MCSGNQAPAPRVRTGRLASPDRHTSPSGHSCSLGWSDLFSRHVLWQSSAIILNCTQQPAAGLVSCFSFSMSRSAFSATSRSLVPDMAPLEPHHCGNLKPVTMLPTDA